MKRLSPFVDYCFGISSATAAGKGNTEHYWPRRDCNSPTREILSGSREKVQRKLSDRAKERSECSGLADDDE